ncbi:MAG: hypothetical protein KKH80_04095 [Candidatus Omnitrophica bacterium]|nr:hypothetical protein [Candidatus Omnitrophota bacterium]
MDKFSLKAQEAVEQAVQIAEKFKHQQVDCQYLLYSLLKQTDKIEITQNNGGLVFKKR